MDKQSWEEHVTRAEKDVPVLIHFYQEGIVECKLLNGILDGLAKKHPRTKFLKTIATKSVENF